MEPASANKMTVRKFFFNADFLLILLFLISFIKIINHLLQEILTLYF